MSNYQNNLENRTLSFSQRVLILCSRIKEGSITKPLITQLVRSATSVGANYAEANNASSKTDFRNKIYIAKKEANETKYWLKLLTPYSDIQVINPLLVEIQELILIFQSIINTLNQKH